MFHKKRKCSLISPSRNFLFPFNISREKKKMEDIYRNFVLISMLKCSAPSQYIKLSLTDGFPWAHPARLPFQLKCQSHSWSNSNLKSKNVQETIKKNQETMRKCLGNNPKMIRKQSKNFQETIQNNQKSEILGLSPPGFQFKCQWQSCAGQTHFQFYSQLLMNGHSTSNKGKLW